LKILHCLGRASDEASGPTHSVLKLARAQGSLGEETLLFSQTGEPYPPSQGFLHNTFPSSPWLSKLIHSPQMAAAMRELRVDVVHNHAMWMAQGIYAHRMRSRGGARLLVTSPRGSLARWAMEYRRWRKRLMWPVFQRGILADSDLFHATGEQEIADIRRYGFRQPIALIANGVEMPDLPDASAPARSTPRRLLFLARIHPIKGLDNLLDAWSELQGRHPGWELAVAGPLAPDAKYDLPREVARRGLERIEILGPVFGEDKSAAYRDAELYVLPSFTENFGLTIAEALAHGTPVVTTRTTPWPMLEEQNAGWWIELGVRPLVQCLDVALALPAEELAQKGARGRKWVERNLGWQSLADKMLAAYRFALEGGNPPDFIDLAR